MTYALRTRWFNWSRALYHRYGEDWISCAEYDDLLLFQKYTGSHIPIEKLALSKGSPKKMEDEKTSPYLTDTHQILVSSKNGGFYARTIEEAIEEAKRRLSTSPGQRMTIFQPTHVLTSDIPVNVTVVEKKES